jgi:hypothetical protein
VVKVADRGKQRSGTATLGEVVLSSGKSPGRDETGYPGVEVRQDRVLARISIGGGPRAVAPGIGSTAAPWHCSIKEVDLSDHARGLFEGGLISQPCPDQAWAASARVRKKIRAGHRRARGAKLPARS